MESTFVVLEI